MGFITLTFFIYGIILYVLIATFKDWFNGPRK